MTAPLGTHSGRAVLGGNAPRQQRTGTTLPFADERHLQAHQWLVNESVMHMQNLAIFL